VTVQLPPPDRLYSVRAVIPGDPTQEAIDRLAGKLSAKGAEGLRRGCSLLISASPEGGAARLDATVNDWHAGAAATRIVTLLLIKAGPGWDVHGASVSAEPHAPP
jgi:hypothetical protein